MELIQALVLSIIQGITEFLPISSSGHLLLVPFITGWDDQGLTVDAALHLATGAAIMAYFWTEWRDMFVNWNKSSLLRKIFIGSIPAMIAGLLFENLIENSLRSPWVVVVMLIAVAGLMWWIEQNYTVVRKVGKESSIKDVRMIQALLIGIAQTIALIPGTSRSGITLIAGMYQGLPREIAAKFAFMLGVPITVGAGLLKLMEISQDPSTNWNVLGFSMIVTFVVALGAIRWLLNYVRNNTLIPFAIYRVVLAVIVAGMLLI